MWDHIEYDYRYVWQLLYYLCNWYLSTSLCFILNRTNSKGIADIEMKSHQSQNHSRLISDRLIYFDKTKNKGENSIKSLVFTVAVIGSSGNSHTVF